MGDDSRSMLFFVASVNVKEGYYSMERHKDEIVVLKEEWERKRAMIDRNETVFIRYSFIWRYLLFCRNLDDSVQVQSGDNFGSNSVDSLSGCGNKIYISNIGK